MKRALIILNYQREVPPFLQNEIMFAKEVFDEIIYLSRRLTKDNRETIVCENVKIFEIPFSQRCMALLFSPFLIFSRCGLTVLKKLLKDKKINLLQLKNLITQIFVCTQLYSTTKSIIRNKKYGKIVILSAWFNAVALAASRLARDGYPSVSFAHSYEIDPTRTPFFEYSFRDVKHRYLSQTYFISEIMMKRYNQYTGEIYKERTSVRYLGSIKRFDSVSSARNHNNFTIVSCSSVVKIKRIQLIIQALMKWQEGRITWIHLGGGPEYKELLPQIKHLSETNHDVKIVFEGKQLTNEEVQTVYASTFIDLFINVSENEGLPVSIMEALSYGIPCIATNVGGTSELINESNGILLNKQFNADELINSILFFKKLTNDAYMIYRSNAYRTWNERFNASVNSREFYKNLISKNL